MPEQQVTYFFTPEACPGHEFWIKKPKLRWIIPQSKCQLCGTVKEEPSE